MQELTLEDRERLDLILSCHLDDIEKRYLAALDRNNAVDLERLRRVLREDQAIRDKLL